MDDVGDHVICSLAVGGAFAEDGEDGVLADGEVGGEEGGVDDFNGGESGEVLELDGGD